MFEGNYNETELTELVKAMRQRAIVMDREGTFWTDEERQFLKESFDKGEDTRVVAATLHRTEEAIWKKMEKLYKQVRPHQSKAENVFVTSVKSNMTTIGKADLFNDIS